jgi:hypothetical protein
MVAQVCTVTVQSRGFVFEMTPFRLWSGSYDVENSSRPATRSLDFYLSIYALLTVINSKAMPCCYLRKR